TLNSPSDMDGAVGMSDQLLNFTSEDGIIIIRPEKSFEVINSPLPKEYKLFTLDGTNIRSKSDLLSMLSRIMCFPDYFGSNWDALEECLRDLAWVPARGYIIQFTHADDFIKTSLSDFHDFVQIVQSAYLHWQKNKVEFLLIVEANI